MRGESGFLYNAEVDYHGEWRRNETHRSTADPEARMARKGKGEAAKLSYAGHLLMENRSALIADMEPTSADSSGSRTHDHAPRPCLAYEVRFCRWNVQHG